ncbi:MAG TPA: alpha/beta hydrolase-fold protein [Thermoanaerobaculia bacterium]|jgi:phospholipase/carboxylesterase
MNARNVMFALALIATTGCATQQQPPLTGGFQLAQTGRIYARPADVKTPSAITGLQKLHLGETRDGLLYVPANYKAPVPLILMLHGSGDSGEIIMSKVRTLADRIGAIVIAPDARDFTWDMTVGGSGDPKSIDRFGEDVKFIDEALRQTFRRYPVDRKRIAIGGFSDGGSYALSLGLMNGDLFTHVIAFSPGFMRLRSTTGHPQVFLAHGTSDDVLPIDQCGRPLARALGEAGYDLEYIEFEGEHVVVDRIAREAFMEWFARVG